MTQKNSYLKLRDVCIWNDSKLTPWSSSDYTLPGESLNSIDHPKDQVLCLVLELPGYWDVYGIYLANGLYLLCK